MRCARSPDIFVSRERVYISFIQCTMVFGFYVPRIGSCKLYLREGQEGISLSIYKYVCVCLSDCVCVFCVICFCLMQVHEICLYLTIGYFGKIEIVSAQLEEKMEKEELWDSSV